MPVYTYVCEKGKTEFEEFASIQKKDLGWQPVYPKCGCAQKRQIFKPVMMISGLRRSPSGGSSCYLN